MGVELTHICYFLINSHFSLLSSELFCAIPTALPGEMLSVHIQTEPNFFCENIG